MGLQGFPYLNDTGSYFLDIPAAHLYHYGITAFFSYRLVPNRNKKAPTVKMIKVGSLPLGATFWLNIARRSTKLCCRNSTGSVKDRSEAGIFVVSAKLLALERVFASVTLCSTTCCQRRQWVVYSTLYKLPFVMVAPVIKHSTRKFNQPEFAVLNEHSLTMEGVLFLRATPTGISTSKQKDVFPMCGCFP